MRSFRKSWTSLGAMLMLVVVFAGPVSAAPDNHNSLEATITCGSGTYTVVISRGNAVVSHPVDSTSRVVGMSFSGAVFVDGEQVATWDDTVGRGHGVNARLMVCDYYIDLSGDGSVHVAGTVGMFLTPARG